MARSEIRGGQIKDDSITGDDVDESTLILNTLRDADDDTKIQIEESADEDKIRFDTAGVERMIINASGNVGIGITTPASTLTIAGSLALNILNINAANDPGTTYSMAATDCVVLANTRSTAQGGIDSAITIELPGASAYPGRVVTVKDAAGYTDVNVITIKRAGSDLINGVDIAVTLASPSSFKTFISDGTSAWQEIGS
jgi:hypothetical protein